MRLPGNSLAHAGLLFGLTLLAACRVPTAPPQSSSEPQLPVRVVALAAAPEQRRLSFPAVLRARERSLVAPQVSGQLRQRPAQLGQQVQAGEILAVLDNPALGPAASAARAELSALSAQADQAAQDLQRAQALRGRELVAQDQVDQAQTALNRLQADRDRAQAQLRGADASAEEQVLRAAHTAVVDRVFFEVGDFVAAGQPVLSLSNPQHLELELLLPPQLAADLDVGATATVRAMASGTSVAATVSRNPRAAAAGSGLVRVLLELQPQDALFAGDAVEVELQARSLANATLPLRALRAVGGVPPVTILINQDGRAHAVPVEPLAVVDDLALLRSDVPIGTPVVVDAPSAIRSGDRLRIVQ